MISIQDINNLLSQVPQSATLRVASRGSSVYFARNGVELTSTINDDTFMIRGLIGETPASLKPGAVVIRAEHVDFVQVIP